MPGLIHDVLAARLMVEIMEGIRNIPGHTRYSITPFATTGFSVPGIIFG